MKYWQPIALYVAVLLALYGTREVESVAFRKQQAAQFQLATSGKSAN